MASLQTEAQSKAHLRELVKHNINVLKKESTFKFLKDCKEVGVLPKTFRIEHKIKGLDVTDILRKTGLIILNKAIRNARGELFKAKKGLIKVMGQNERAVKPEDLAYLNRVIEREKKISDNKYSKKLTWLLNTESIEGKRKKYNGFINKSNWTFTAKQLNLLKNGPNYVVPKKGIPRKKIALDMINATEAVAKEKRCEVELMSLLTMYEEKNNTKEEKEEIEIYTSIRESK